MSGNSGIHSACRVRRRFCNSSSVGFSLRPKQHTATNENARRKPRLSPFLLPVPGPFWNTCTSPGKECRQEHIRRSYVQNLTYYGKPIAPKAANVSFISLKYSDLWASKAPSRFAQVGCLTATPTSWCVSPGVGAGSPLERMRRSKISSKRAQI